MPMRQPLGMTTPASSPASRRGSRAVDLDLAVGGLEGHAGRLRRRHRRAAPAANRSTLSWSGTFDRLPQCGRCVEHLGRTADVGGAALPVGDHGVQVVGPRQVDAAAVGGDPVDDAESGVLVAERGELLPEEGVVAGSVRSARARRRRRDGAPTSVRTIDITGVRPLPAVSMSRGRGCSGRTKSPCGGARKRTWPGRVLRTSASDTLPLAVTVMAGSAPDGALSE